MRSSARVLLISSLIVIASVLCAASAAAESKKKRWHWDLFLEEEVYYDSNTFVLSDRLRDRLDDDRPGDRVSGRFDDMDEEDDFVVSSSVELVAKAPRIGDSRFRIIPSVTYDYFTQNEEKSHPTFGLTVDHNSGTGTASLDLEYELDAFRKNYLEDATDLTGFVSSRERVYDRGEYDKFSATIGYDTRLWKRRKKERSFLDARRVEGSAEIGYSRRDYDGPFYNRDRNSAVVGLGMTTEFGKRWKLDLDYDFDYVATDNGREVVIRDEPDFGVDFNGDGDTTDLNRRTVQRIDRTRMDHAVELRLRYDITKRWDTWASYAFRYQHYFSDERFDTHRDREDFRHSVHAGVGWEIDSRWSLELKGLWHTEEANKKDFGDDDERGTDYNRFIVSFGVVLKLF